MNRQRFRFSPRLLVNNLALTQKGAMTYALYNYRKKY